jgi:hypothetical protein
MGSCRSAPRIRPASLSSALSGGHFEERINNISLLSFPCYICDTNVQIYIYTFDKYISNINFVQIFSSPDNHEYCVYTLPFRISKTVYLIVVYRCSCSVHLVRLLSVHKVLGLGHEIFRQKGNEQFQ